MPQLTYPGVYIEEVPSGVRTITGVPTSIAAFIDFFAEGPMNEATLVQGMTDFGRIFGGLDDRSEASYAISQFFLNGGTDCYVVRVANSAADASVSGNVLKTATTTIQDGSAADVLIIQAANEGDWGNYLRIDIDHDTDDPTTQFNLYARRYNDDFSSILAEESFLNLSVDPNDDRYVETIVNDGSALIQLTHDTATTNLPATTGTAGSVDITAFNQAAFDALVGKKFTVQIGSVSQTATLDTWTTGTSGDVTKSSQLRAKVEKAIRQAAPLDSSFAGATVALVNKMFVVRSGKTVRSDNSGDDYKPEQTITIVNNGADTTAATLGFDSGTTLANVQEYQVGKTSSGDVGAWIHGDVGGDGSKPGATEIVGSQAVDPPTGLYALDKVDLFNILCIPRAADLVSAETTSVVTNAITYCRDRRAFMILDIPETTNTLQDMKDWMDENANFRDNNTAVYFPRLEIPDPLNDYRLRDVGCSGTIAGIYSRTDGARGVWKAPAGIEATLDGVSDLAYKMSDRQNGVLNPLGINCLRNFPINGMVVWGARTTEGADALASEWKYVPIRRFTLFLEESLFRGTKWVVFEPNDEPLWANIRLNVGAFMQSLFRQHAFQGTAPKDAYYVKCDSETTTQDDRNKGIVNIEVGFAPLKPAEFVVIKIQQMRGDL